MAGVPWRHPASAQVDADRERQSKASDEELLETGEVGEHRRDEQSQSGPAPRSQPWPPKPPGERGVQRLATRPEATSQQRCPGQQGHERHDIGQR